MNQKTVRRWKAVEAFKGKPVQAAYGFDNVPMETEFYMASDYDALRTQARELAEAVQMLCEKHGHTDYPSYQRAQAVLDATKEGR